MADGFTIGLWSNQQTDRDFLRTMLASNGFIQGPAAVRFRFEQMLKNLKRDGHGTRDGQGRTPEEADAWRMRICNG